MVVHDLDVFRTGSRPAKAHSKLVVHSNAVLTGPISLEFFKAITWRDAKISKFLCDLQLAKFTPCDRFDICESRDSPSVCKSFRITTSEGLNHVKIVT